MIRPGKTVRGANGLWTILPEGVERPVLVPDEMRKGVVFLYYRKGGEFVPAATAFFVGFPVPDYPNRALSVVLTAQHVIAGIKQKSDDQKVLLRLNTKDGGATWLEVGTDAWYHQDGASDWAMLLWNPAALPDADYRAWHLGSSATVAVMDREQIGIGDEVFMIGLFRNHLGRDRNEPILRVGNIAAMPADPIRTRLFGDMRAYLVEARSIGGLSGSPVFVHLGYSRFREGEFMHWTPDENAAGPFVLLGLMHGHWDAIDADIDLLGKGERINMGIGIVVPIQDVLTGLNTLMQEVANVRKEQLDAEHAATMDEPTTDLAAEDEFERFEDLTRKLVNTPKQKNESES